MVTRRLLLTVATFGVAAFVGACSQPSPVSLEEETSSYHVQLELDGTSLGQRTASIEITDASRRPVDAERVVVSTAMPSMEMNGLTIVADEIETGRYEAQGDLFTMLGESTLTVRIEGSGSAAAEQATFTVEAEP